MNRVSIGDWLVERLFFLSKASMVQLQISKSCTFKSPFRPSSIFPRQGCFEALKSVPSLQHSAFLGLKFGLSKAHSWRGKRICLPDQKFDVQPSSWGKAVGSSKHIGDIRSTNGYQDNQTMPNQYIDGHVDVVKVAAYKWAKKSYGSIGYITRRVISRWLSQVLDAHPEGSAPNEALVAPPAETHDASVFVCTVYWCLCIPASKHLQHLTTQRYNNA